MSMELEPMKSLPGEEKPVEDDNESDTSGGDSTNQRQSWSSQMDFIMASLGCAVGLGNIWRFPYLCYRNGGGAFLIPYLLMFFCAAAPIFILEISVGQYTRSGCVGAWNIVPAFRGIGYASQVMMIYVNVYYMIIIAWAIYYIAVSFTAELPWASCGNEWNTDRCHATGMTLNTTTLANCTTANCSSLNVTSTLKRVDAVVEYWENGVLHMSDGIETAGKIVPGLAVALLAAWVLVFFCICRGVKWTGKIVYFTAAIPYVLLTVLLVRGLTLEGSVDGLVFYLKPDFSRLKDAQVWIEGGTQILYSMGVAQGYQVTLGGYNKFNADCVRNGLVVITVNCLTSLYGGLVVFSILGFMAHELGQSIHTVVDTGPGLVFLAYPKAVSQMAFPQLWSVLLFLTIFFVGVDSQFVAVEGFLTPIADRFPRYLYKTTNRMILTAAYCSFCFLLGLTMITEGGVYVFRLIDYYCLHGLVLLIVVTFEALVVGWFFGADRYCDALEMMTGRRYGLWLKISWKYLTPLLTQAIFWFEVFSFKPLQFDSRYEYPSWATGLGIFIILSSTLCIPVTMLMYMCRSYGSLKQRWSHITTPLLEKHQVHPSWIEKGYKWTLKNFKADAEMD